MKKWIELSFEVGDEVYLKTDSDQAKRIVTGICMRINGLTYELSRGSNVTTWHYDFEISKEISILTKVTTTTE